MIAVTVSSGFAAWCGLAAPVLLGVYLEIGARLRPGYDKTRHTISELGDGVDVTALLFLVVNVIVGVLLFVFGRWAISPVFGDVWWLVAIAAAGSVIIGITPGDKNCLVPGWYGRPSPLFHTAHNVVTASNVALIGAIPWVVWIKDLGWYPSIAQFRWVNDAIAIGFPIAVAAFAVAVVLGRRQLRSRLIRTGGRTPRTAGPPWEEPRVWLDRFGTGERIVFAIGYTWVVAAALAELWPSAIAAGSAAFFAIAIAMTLKRQSIVPQVRFSTETCQGNTVYGHHAKLGEFRFLRITDPAEFRASLGDYNARRSSRYAKPPGRYAITIGFTHDGLLELGEPYRWAADREDLFGIGMAQRRQLLGDKPNDWEPGWEGLHVAIWAVASGDSPDEAREQMAKARQEIDRLRGVASATEPGTIRGRVNTDDDHPLFQFPDGVSQPWIREVPPHRVAHQPLHPARDPRGGGKMATWGRWQPLAVGEFVLGQVDEANDVFPVPDPAPLFVGATFAALRKLELQPDRLDRVLDELSVRADDDDDEALSRLMGRRVDGSPLIDKPKGDNGFRYDSDPYGRQCPITAHIRRANPRDSLGFSGLLANRRRMIRRGLFYLSDADSEDGRLGGLMFVSLQARLDDQFEFVQRSWLNDGGAFGLGRDPDVIAGHWDGPRQVLLPGNDGPKFASLPEPVVIARGGAYLVVPSIRGLHYLARQTTPTKARPPSASAPARQLGLDPTAVRA